MVFPEFLKTTENTTKIETELFFEQNNFDFSEYKILYQVEKRVLDDRRYANSRFVPIRTV